MRKAEKKVLMAAPLYLIWAIWKERNIIVFENANLSLHRLKTTFVLSIWSWAFTILKQVFLFIRNLLLIFRD